MTVKCMFSKSATVHTGTPAPNTLQAVEMRSNTVTSGSSNTVNSDASNTVTSGAKTAMPDRHEAGHPHA